MEKVLRIFPSFEEADVAEYAAYAKMSPEKRLNIALQLYWLMNEDDSETSQRLERVYRFTTLEEG